MQKSILFLFSIILLIASSCGSDDDVIPVPVVDTGLEINLTSPTDGEKFTPGDVLEVRGSVSDDVEITAITVAISGILDESALMLNGTGAMVDLTDVNVTLNNNIPADTYTFTIKATDDENNTLSESVDITIE